MGCGLNKLEKQDERPGNIYSTLKRPHVETKTDVSYEYRFVDFTTSGQAEAPGSPAIRLSSLRDLPAQLHDLYQQGFTVAAIHPFVQSSDGRERIPQEQIFRAVLIKKTERNPTTVLNNEEYSLEVELCLSPDQLTDQKLIPDLVKRIEDAASQGSKFAGIIQGYCTQQNLPHSPSDSLSHVSSSEFTAVKKTCSDSEDDASLDKEKSDCTNGSRSAAPSRENADQCKVLGREEPGTEQQNIESSPANKGEQLEDLHFSISTEDVFIQDKITATDSSTLPGDHSIGRTEILAIFNKPKALHGYRKYYTVNIPMKISKEGNSITGLEANWLEYMTEHFRKGCSLVNAVFYLGMVNDISSEFTDGVFIFEDFPEQDVKSIRRYDAIVVEQWTVLEGLEVQADYMPLLNSLAVYGWQLTCVLSTPIVKNNREGNVTTKQIVFLQRPALPHKMKKKEPKFQWRFSKEEKQGKRSKKVKGKMNAKENQHMDGKKELDKNRKNEELTKIDDATDCNIHGNHQADGDIHSNSDDVNEEIITPPKNKDNEESKVSLTPKILKASLYMEGVTEEVEEMDLDGVEKSQVSSGEEITEGAEEKEAEVTANAAEDNRDLYPVEAIQEQGGD